MKVTLEKKQIKSLHLEAVYIYKYTKQFRWKHTNFHFSSNIRVYEEYNKLLNDIRLKFIDLDEVTEFKGISREEIIKDLERMRWR